MIATLAGILGGAIGLYLFINWALNGSPFLTNYHAVWIGNTPHETPFGFGRGFWNIYHTPEAGLKNMGNNFLRLNVWLLGWPVGFLFVAVRMIRRGSTAADWILFSSLVLSFAMYFFFFWPGISETGPVLYYELVVPLILLTARGLFAAIEWMAVAVDRERAVRRVGTFVAIAVFLAAISTTQTYLRALKKPSSPSTSPTSSWRIAASTKASSSWTTTSKATTSTRGSRVAKIRTHCLAISCTSFSI
ncbi:MAG: hypothetical protein M5R36_21455 [Deltaproteobacteria bacterium]|nr:hypothetical protein [Deltaproteobacteria bacterium]